MKPPWLPVAPLEARRFREVRRRTIFHGCKWDPQVEDVGTLSPQPIVLPAETWRELAALAEQLARETLAAERELLRLDEDLRDLGLPWSLRRKWRAREILVAAERHPRFIRFDFHFTTEGWRISEANSDVPGGFTEGSGFARLMAEHYPGLTVPGDPTRALAEALRTVAGPGGVVALTHATAYTDDRQAMEFLARALTGAGLRPVLAAPDHLRWEEGEAFLATDAFAGRVGAVFRFFPAEWLPALPRRCGWWHLLGAARMPLCNPGSALLTQSKRFPLRWPSLPFPLPAWERLLPPTFDPRRLPVGVEAADLVLKPALGRVGDSIRLAGVTPEKEARQIARWARWHPRDWAAQARFEAVPMGGPAGGLFPCIGVFTLNGRACGAFGRVARTPLINHLAQDAAVLVAEAAPALPVPNPPVYATRRTLQPVGA